MAGVRDVAVIGVGPAEDAEAAFPDGVVVEQFVGRARGGANDVIQVVKDVGHGQDAELFDEGDRIGDADHGHVEIPAPDILDHFRLVPELAGGKELHLDRAVRARFHNFLETGADGPHFGINRVSHADFKGELFPGRREGREGEEQGHGQGEQAFEHRRSPRRVSVSGGGNPVT